jgi:hypothetical protein
MEFEKASEREEVAAKIVDADVPVMKNGMKKAIS